MSAMPPPPPPLPVNSRTPAKLPSQPDDVRNFVTVRVGDGHPHRPSCLKNPDQKQSQLTPLPDFPLNPITSRPRTAILLLLPCYSCHGMNTSDLQIPAPLRGPCLLPGLAVPRPARLCIIDLSDHADSGYIGYTGYTFRKRCSHAAARLNSHGMKRMRCYNPVEGYKSYKATRKKTVAAPRTSFGKKYNFCTILPNSRVPRWHGRFI
jgi:hypothetical protein